MILPRYYCDRYGRCYNRSSSWYSYGRWIVTAVIIVIVLVLFFLCALCSARRRRRRGMQPWRGTGWAAGGAPGHGHGHGVAAPYQTGQPVQGQAPPMYSSPAPNYGANGPPPQGYFGGQGAAPQQQNGVELQHPQNTYQRGQGNDSGFAPPPGPPPGKS